MSSDPVCGSRLWEARLQSGPWTLQVSSQLVQELSSWWIGFGPQRPTSCSSRDGLKKSGRHISHCQTASSCGLNRAAVGAGSPASLVVAGCPALPMAPKKASVAYTQRHALSVLSFERSPGVLQSRRGAAKHQGCCKPQGVLRSTRGDAKHKGRIMTMPGNS